MSALVTRPAALNQVHLLHPGDVACGARGDRFETLLGSCVAIVLTDARRSVGAMCHIVHSHPAPPGAPRSTARADAALERMALLLRERGIDAARCEAYAYGGGNMFPQLFPREHVGRQNARWVLDELAASGVRLLAHDLGGARYRRLSWTVGPGEPQVCAVEV